MVLGDDDTEDGQPEVPETQAEKEQFEKYIADVKEQAKAEALESLSAEQEFAIAQGFIAKSGKKFLGSEGKYPFLSEAVNSGEEKLKRVSNLQQWEIEKVKVFTRLETFLNKVGMNDFSASVNSEKEEILKLSTSKEGMLLGIAGTEALISKNTQSIENGDKKK
jgi:hypothetical protein